MPSRLISPSWRRGYTTVQSVVWVVASVVGVEHSNLRRQFAYDRLFARSRDLVDLVVLTPTQTVDAAMLKTAIEAERLHRRLPRIEAFAAPSQWEKPYSNEAKTVSECEGHRTLDDAVELIRRFLDPVLCGEQLQGTWSPSRLSWH